MSRRRRKKKQIKQSMRPILGFQVDVSVLVESDEPTAELMDDVEILMEQLNELYTVLGFNITPIYEDK